jgi:hypothetical protein
MKTDGIKDFLEARAKQLIAKCQLTQPLFAPDEPQK